MANRDSGIGSQLWNDLGKVRVTRGELELPVTADKNGIQIGSYELPRPVVRNPEKPRRRLLDRILRRD